MMTIVTHVHLRQGAGPDWDAAMRRRLSAARKASGWIGGQLLRLAEKPDRRVIVGTWRTRADWEAWHHDPHFTETRQRLMSWRARPPSTGGTTSCSMSGKAQRHPHEPPSLQASGGSRARRRAHDGARADGSAVAAGAGDQVIE